MPDEMCPVCAGKGVVPPGFYTDAPRDRNVVCRTCGGRQTVPVEEAASAPGGALDLTYQPD